jgi:hypothetical protein
MTAAPGTLAWFEIATSDPDAAEKFYGSLFDWSFNPDGPAASGGMDYRNITASGADAPMGGIANTGGQMPNHGVLHPGRRRRGHMCRRRAARRFARRQVPRAGTRSPAVRVPS